MTPERVVVRHEEYTILHTHLELAENNAAWLYEHTAIGDAVLVY
jgi:hypothetical protein